MTDKNLNMNPADELLQCFDEQGRAIEPRRRGEVHTEPLQYWHGVVNIWVAGIDGKILCSRRSSWVSGNPGKWQSYFGGHVRAGDSFRETAIRELQEEIGLSVHPDMLYLVDKGQYLPSKHFYESYLYVFSGNLDAIKFNDGEIDQVKWLGMEEYQRDRENNPTQWCNGLSPENQARIKDRLHLV
ncbi:MAG: NUDIX domain-containing protein [Minisyncoccia bacterium]|jgi:isopentenyldiphosphate isomerase